AVCFTNVGKHANVRANHFLQSLHLPWLGNSCLEDSERVFLRHLPDAERNTCLRIITSRASYNVVIGMKELVEPFFNNSLPITTGSSNHANIDARPVRRRRLL